MRKHPITTYRDPNVPDGETIRYRIGLASGEGEVAYGSAQVTHDGPDRYVLHLHVPHEQLEVKVEEGFTRANGRITPSYHKSEAMSGDRLVSREEGYFDGTSHIQFGGAVEPYPDNLVPLLGASLTLRGMGFAKGESHTFNIWLAFSVYWQLDLKVEKRELLQLPVGAIDTWRVKLRPSFAQISPLLDKIVGGLLPDFVLNFEADGSHRMVRFQFPTGPFPWNPKGLVEAVELS